MWAGPTLKKEKRQHYILCQSYPQALKCQINSGHYRIAVHNGFYVIYSNLVK